MCKIRHHIRSYLHSKTGDVLTRYAMWVSIGAVILGILSVTSAELIVGVIEQDKSIQQASHDDLVKEDGDYETADTPDSAVTQRPVSLPFLRRLGD
jgi:hypothetical protein